MACKLLNEDTIALLKECDAGCKTATNSMERVMEYVENPKLENLIREANLEHIELAEECHRRLNNAGEQDKDPKPMAKFMSKAETDVKMTINGDSHQAAKLLMDGCNMGIQSLSEYMNKYKGADPESVHLAEALRGIEKRMMDGLQEFL